MITRKKNGALIQRYRIAAPLTKSRWYNVLAGLDRFVRDRGWWPSAWELAEYLDGGLKREAMRRELVELRDDPVPLVSYGRKQWSLTFEGWRQLGREPVTARYPFRPRTLPARERKRRARVRLAAVKVFEGRGGDIPIVD